MQTFISKLPQVGTSIFTEMSMLAHQHNAINLSQGFPEFDAPELLKSEITKAIIDGKNQYSPANGLPDLLEQIASLIHRKYQTDFTDVAKVVGAKNITITSGATEALWVAIQTVVRPDDEVIIFDPAYDSYQPAIELAGGRCKRISLDAPDYKINWQVVKSQISSNTRAIIINSPHNPTGTIMSADDMEKLQSIILENNLYLISDEVYEHITFDGEDHQSALRFPELFERAFVVSSFGKTFHCTGWKMGYCVAPTALSIEFRKIHQYVTFCSFTPAQIALTNMLANGKEHIDELSRFYQQKRDVLVKALSHSRFKILPSKGTYFVLLDYSDISSKNDVEFCHYLTKEIGVAAIPLSPFYDPDTIENYQHHNKIIRLCFAKHEPTLLKAAELLCQL